MIKNGIYGKYKNKIYPIILSSNNTVYVLSNDDSDFELNDFSENKSYKKNPQQYEKYYITVTRDDIDWVCRISYSGYYKEFKVGIKKETEYYIVSGFVPESNTVFTIENGFDRVDRFVYEGYVPKSEVSNIQQNRYPYNDQWPTPKDWNFKL